ncbi:MAG: hypothetical protein ND895_16680 [Pyrinomonadaceae bacterium]|nr:hypothetical protein [Pyrinomonadaceae bacterium]
MRQVGSLALEGEELGRRSLAQFPDAVGHGGGRIPAGEGRIVHARPRREHLVGGRAGSGGAKAPVQLHRVCREPWGKLDVER